MNTTIYETTHYAFPHLGVYSVSWVDGMFKIDGTFRFLERVMPGTGVPEHLWGKSDDSPEIVEWRESVKACNTLYRTGQADARYECEDPRRDYRKQMTWDCKYETD